MKKIFAFLCLIAFTGFLRAEPLRSSIEEPVSLKYEINSLVASTSTLLVSRLNTTSYPHKRRGSLNVAGISVDVNKVAASSGTVKLGVVTAISTQNANVSFFFEMPFERSASGTEVSKKWDPEFFRRLHVDSSNNTTPFLLTNDKLTSSTIFQTDVVLPSPTGGAAPNLGDIVMQMTTSGVGPIDINVELLYNSEN